MGWAQTEKKALLETLRGADPDAATLCTGWDTRRLLAHLVQREQEHRGAFADALAHAEPGQEKHLGRLVDSARTTEGYAALVDRFEAGPSRWSPMVWAGDQVNLLEYVIHHEDVRRVGSAPVAPRILPEAQQQRIWKQLPLMARLTFLRAPVGVTLALPGGPSVTVKRGAPGVTLTGRPVELALWISGRRAVAQVQVSGSPEAVRRLQAWLDRG